MSAMDEDDGPESNALNTSTSASRKQRYKELLDLGEAVEKKSETDDICETLNRIKGLLKTSHEIRSEGNMKQLMDNTTECVMDAQVIKMSHELLQSALQKADNCEFSDDEFASAMKRFLQTDGTELNWDNLARLGCSMAKSTRFAQSLYGTFEHDEPTKVADAVVKERHKRTRTQETQQMKPEAVVALRNEEKHAQHLNLVMSQINEIYQRNNSQPIPYYPLILDPTNFMNSVDNAFQISFLFRDGAIFFETDDNGNPTIRPTTKNEKDQKDELESHQFVVSLNVEICEKLIAKYNITEPLLDFRRGP